MTDGGSKPTGAGDRLPTNDDRNIVMVSIDSLRGDHCGYLGDDRGLTPTMDTLADDGVAYENAIAPGPQTFSSMPAVFTGYPRPSTLLEEFPQESHWERRLAAIDDHLARYATFPERLQELGYDTGGVTPNPWTSETSGFDRGFDQFEDLSEDDDGGVTQHVAECLPGVDTDARPVRLVLNMLSGSEFFSQWETLLSEVHRVREQLSEPYFLWVFILDTHFPFLASRGHREEQSLLETYYSAYRSADQMRGNGSGGMSAGVKRSTRRSYRDTVRASDAFLAQLRTDLADDNPVLVVHSDHGESLGEHENYGHHHREVYEENVHVPYLVHNADVTADVSAPTSLTSVADTVISIAEDGTFDPETAGEPYAHAASECGYNRTVRGSRFKYVELGERRFLFDLEQDPEERTDASRDRPDLCRELERRLERETGHVEETDRLRTAAKVVASLKKV